VSLYDLKVGDRVQVFEQWSRNVPAGGWDGEVVKVGTKLITVKYEYREWVFRLETGQVNDKNFSYHARIETVEQVQEDMRRSQLTDSLQELGLQLTRTNSLTTDQIETVVRALGGTE
jgi:hypothetical protein